MDINSKLATCLICLKNNYNEKNLILFDLFTQEWENVTYLNKLQNILNAEIIVYEETLICSSCLDDLNKAYDFKERVIRALDYWSTKFEETVTFQSKINEPVQDINDVNDNNEISEPSTFNEDIVVNIETNVENDKIESSDSGGDVVESSKEPEPEPELEPDCSNFPCDKCKLIFVTASELMHHNCKEDVAAIEPVKKPKKRKKQKSELCRCDFCDLSFSKVWKLNKHLKMHTIDKKFVCSFCNQAFKQSYHLREHITSHTGERNFSCGVCGKKFQRMSSQKRHMRTHVAAPGEKSKKTPFLCNICGKSFPYSNGAQRHMRIHTGDKRHSCNVCGKKFNQSTHLKVHLRTHTGERPYMCNMCGDTFSLKASLHKHLNAHSEGKNDVKIFQNLEPNLSQTQSLKESEKKNYVDDAPLCVIMGF